MLSGGTGDDVVDGGTGGFQLTGGPGADHLGAEQGNGLIDGGAGADHVAVRDVSGSISGGTGPDRLAGNGSLVNATFSGGAGNDEYVFGPGTQCASVFELSGQGVDTVRTSRCVTGLENVERVILTGDKPLAMSTGAGSQTIIGNDAANRLSGGLHGDVMRGGGGPDLIVLGHDAFDVAEGGAGADRFLPTGTPAEARGNLLPADAVAHRILDFNAGEGDRIILPAAVFGSTVRSLATRFTLVSGPQPQAAEPVGTLLWNTRSGLLSFDRDGSGPITPKVIALLPLGTHPAPSMFLIR